MYVQQAKMHTHKEYIKVKYRHPHRQSISASQLTIPRTVLHACTLTCVSASESLNALMTTVLTQVF